VNSRWQTLIIAELARLEAANYVGLLGVKYLSESVTIPDAETGCRVRAINIQPVAGWAIVAFGKSDEEVKHKFLRDLETGWVYDGVEQYNAVH